MCGILAILDISDDPTALRPRAVELARRLRHRGPDWSGVRVGRSSVLCHERLAIVDVEHGAQPLRSPDGARALAVNGEIYNHRQLAAELERPYAFTTRSDCEVLLPLAAQGDAGFLERVNGIFAFVLVDDAAGSWFVARDPIGVVPLYTGRDEAGRRYFASELKAIADTCVELEEFPPGHWWSNDQARPVPFYRPPWRDYERVKESVTGSREIRTALEAAVHRQLMCDVPYGVLLSGGLDSSVIAAVASRATRRRVEDDDRSEAWWPRLHTFSIGLEGSPDLAAARRVAAAIESVHHEFHFTVQEGLDALPEVVEHIETYDVTTVRASTPMYLMARKIKAMGVKMVLSGEGADEIFGGYLYFHRAPSDREFHAETVRKLDGLHQFDCLRANKATAAWGVEARVPFLDRQFLDVAMSVAPRCKMVAADGAGAPAIEKRILREAFAGALPEEILWRQKEQFSDGVGYSWIDALKSHAERRIGPGQLAAAAERYPVHPPTTAEAYLYRTLFAERFPGEAAARCVPGGPSIACSSPAAIAWDPAFRTACDPSGRAVAGVHRQGKLGGGADEVTDSAAEFPADDR